MDPSEVEFLGEKQFVAIVPNFSFGIIHLISGKVGPFRAGIPVKVPIWLALSLKQQQKCRILPQDWMNVEELETTYENEKSSKIFTRMASNHFMDEAQLLLTAAPDDIPDIDNIRTAIKDLWDLRMAKLRSSTIKLIESSGTYAKLDHLTAMEINSMRSLLPDSLDMMLHMKQKNHSENILQSQGIDTPL